MGRTQADHDEETYQNIAQDEQDAPEEMQDYLEMERDLRGEKRHP